ncbi:hypothetical protein N9C35_04905, partial [Flavobacteriaceae bacterium]|nr:hypothetical protein [Flavobacteriaceae bacterium]
MENLQSENIETHQENYKLKLKCVNTEGEFEVEFDPEKKEIILDNALILIDSKNSLGDKAKIIEKFKSVLDDETGNSFDDNDPNGLISI